MVNNLVVTNNEIYNIDHGLGGGSNTDGSSTFSNISLHDNHLHDFALWDTGAANTFHHDGFHLFAYAANGSDYNVNNVITGVNIYNNRFDGDFGNNNTANIFFEGNVQNANLFNNVTIVYPGRQLNVGMFDGLGTNINFFNNTAIGDGAANQTQKYSVFQGPGIVVKNNVYTDGGTISTQKPFPKDCPSYTPCQTTSFTLATNAYIAAANYNNGFGYCPPTPNNSTSGCNSFLNFTAAGFAAFEAGTSETGGIFREVTTSTILNTVTGAEFPGSPTIAAGTNLSNLCAGNGGPLPNALCSDIVGNPRPASGAWDIGAYQSNPGPNPPTSLSVTVH